MNAPANIHPATQADKLDATNRPDLRAQRAYRKRRTAKIERLEDGHRQILAKLEGRTTPVAVELRAISAAALGIAQEKG